MLINKYEISVILLSLILILSNVLNEAQFVKGQSMGMQKTIYPTVELKWVPAEPIPEQEVTFTIEFKRPGSSTPKSHIDYIFTISNEGNTVYTVTKHTHSGTDSLKQKLASGVYDITITVEAIDFTKVEPNASDFSLSVKSEQIEPQPQQETVLVIEQGEIPVEIDGLWSMKTEWADASEMKISNDELTGYVRAKHDGVYVYLLIDFLSDHGLDPSGDFAVVCFDTNSNAGNVPLADDYCFYRVTRTGDFVDGIIQGNGVDWTVLQEADTWDPYDEKFDAAIGSSHMNDPYDSINTHVIYEFRIPIDFYGLNEIMRFYVYVNDAYTNRFIEWPANAGAKQFKLVVKNVLPAPDGWGDLHLKLDKNESDISKPELQLEEKEEKVEVRVQAKQIKDLIIVRVRNMDDSTQDIHGFKISLSDSLLSASKGPKEWVKEVSNDKEVMFSTSAVPIRAGDNGYFLLKVNVEKPNIEWAVYGLDNREVGEGSTIPFLR